MVSCILYLVDAFLFMNDTANRGKGRFLPIGSASCASSHDA